MSGGRKIQNFDALATTPLRRAALELAEAAYEALDTKAAVQRKLVREGDSLLVDGTRFLLSGRRVVYVGIGKCAAAAGAAIEELLGEYLESGIALDVAVPSVCTTTKIECIFGTHPKPSEENVAGTARIVSLLNSLHEDDLALVLVSGGGSTLLCQPTGTLAVADEAVILGELFRGGASIQEINTLRKHISPARGGGLARAANGADVLGLVISDVPGNDLSCIASGPTVLDESTVDDAMAIVRAYELSHIKQGDLIETPKERADFSRIHNVLFLSNRDALEAMRVRAQELGFAPNIASETMTGEASVVAHDMTSLLSSAPAGSAYLWGGETTVTVGEAKGQGGRNQELALAALELVPDDGLVLSFASDGHDNTDAAGAIADAKTSAHAKALGISPAEFLQNHQSYDFFQKTGDALKTGYTGSNISDLVIALRAV